MGEAQLRSGGTLPVGWCACQDAAGVLNCHCSEFTCFSVDIFMIEETAEGLEKVREVKTCLKLCWRRLPEPSGEGAKEPRGGSTQEMNAVRVLDRGLGRWLSATVSDSWAFCGPFLKVHKARKPFPKQRSLHFFWKISRA